MSLEENKYQSPYEQKKRSRAAVNIIGFSGMGGSSVDELGNAIEPHKTCPIDSQWLVEQDKDTLICTKCGHTTTSFAKDIRQKAAKVKQKGKGSKDNKLFIVSQGQQKRKPDHVEEAERIFGGEVTSWNESEYSYDQ